MTHLLCIEASPRQDRSASSEVARAAIDSWRQADPTLTIDTLNVWTTPLPEFDGPAMEAKYAGLTGAALTPEQEKAWSEIRKLACRFHMANAIVLAAPLWNFSIPYKLKQLIDAVSQKDLLFTFDEHGLNGTLANRKALLVLARGLDYTADGPVPAERYDFQKPYLEAWLRFVGITEIETVIVEKTLFGPEIDRAARDAAKDAARAIAQKMAGANIP
jgi:FMN-dependent NADH-azoreductase